MTLSPVMFPSDIAESFRATLTLDLAWQHIPVIKMHILDHEAQQLRLSGF